MKIPAYLRELKTSLFTNKYITYLSLILVLIRLADYIWKWQYVHILYYFLTVLSVYYFTDNITIICLVTFLTTSFCLCKYGKEGLENQVDNKPISRKKNKKSFIDPDDNMEGIAMEEGIASSVHNNEPEASQSKQGKKKGGPRIDYASTLEESYENLNDVLGGEGISKLTKDTQGLMSQQLKLAEAMNNMSPLLQQAQSLLKSFDPKSMTAITDLLKPKN